MPKLSHSEEGPSPFSNWYRVDNDGAVDQFYMCVKSVFVFGFGAEEGRIKFKDNLLRSNLVKSQKFHFKIYNPPVAYALFPTRFNPLSGWNWKKAISARLSNK
ncbi:jg795 [Pararge aegeria aegeria]|uniref:Jg795 protein n=1 Tax=Pararge aegeria aegeria TaxID=348720 RepID=A0A8S4QGZ6_9NEOP|nr:jg795 [Pararge aegeria aegeria]